MYNEEKYYWVNRNKRPIIQCDANGETVPDPLKFDGVGECAQYFRSNYSTITAALRNKTPLKQRNIWLKYDEDRRKELMDELAKKEKEKKESKKSAKGFYE